MREGGKTKECLDCERVLPDSKFKRVKKTGYVRRTCTKCINVKDRYGISGKEFYRMLIDQLNSCLICEGPINENTAHVDHCHDGKNVRGLLCMKCNLAIGHLNHNKEISYRAFEYLRFFK